MTAHSAIVSMTSKRMLWADCDVESDSELSSDFSRFSGSAKNGSKKQTSDSPSCATSASGDDSPLPQQSLASIPLRSGACTPSSTASSKSRNCLRNIPLTREHLQKLQSAPTKPYPTTEDMDACSSMWDASSTVISNSVVTSDVSTLIMQAEPQQSDLSAEGPFNTEGGGQWSVGSLGHDSGTCKPCMFLFSKTGCFAGPDCQFCHFSHCRSKFPRPSKGKRDRIKRLLTSALEQEDPKEALRSWSQSTCSQTS